MNLKEYMQMKYPNSKKKHLNSIEFDIFGILDRSKGWFKRNEGLELTQEQINKVYFRTSSLRGSKKSKTLGRIANAVKDYEVTDNKYVYLMKNANEMLKIGISVDPIRRARNISTSSGVPTHLVAFWKVDRRAVEVESKLLKHFKRRSTLGEWFSPNSFSIQEIEAQIGCNFERKFLLEDVYKKVERSTEKHSYERVKFQTNKAKLFVIQGIDVWVPKAVIEVEKDGELETSGTFLSEKISGLLKCQDYFSQGV